MPNKFFFSINLLIKSDTHLEKAISSVIEDESFFTENVQLILIDSLCSKLSLDICTSYSRRFPDNIFFVDACGKNEGECYNDAMPLCTGMYTAYIDNYGEYSKKTLKELMKTLKNGRIPILCIQPVLFPAGEEPRPYVSSISPGLVDLRKYPDRFVLMFGSYFFNRKQLSGLSFDTGIRFHSDVKYITEAYLSTYSYIYTDACCYTTIAPCELDPFKYEPQYNRSFYSQTIDELIIPMLVSCAGSVLAQSVMLYLLELRFALNADEKYKHVIIGNYVDDFMAKASEALKYIDDYVILNRNICKRCRLDEETAFRLLRVKYKNEKLRPETDLAGPKDSLEKSYFLPDGKLSKRTLTGEFVASVGQAVVGTSREISAELTAINYDDEGLYIDGCLNGCSFFESDEYKVIVNINGERSEVIPSGVYTYRKYFDIPFMKRFSFRFYVPVSTGKTMDTFCLTMKYGKLLFRIGMTFSSTFSRLSTKLKNSYWLFLDRVMTYDRKTRSVVIRRATDSLIRRCESKLLSEASQYVSMTEFLYYRQLRKNVQSAMQEKLDHKYILFYDDTGINYNGSILFRYFSRRNKNEKLEVFFSGRRGSQEYEFLAGSEYENLLETGSRKSKLIALCSDVIVASDCDVYESLAFNKKDMLFLKDLLHAKIVSVKNFFMTYASAQFDNRIRDNTQMFLCASATEKEHILRSVYDYDESMVRVTGYPVLDMLSNKKEKLILIAPSERRQFCIYENSGHYRFSESRFFKLYNALLTDTELHRKLKENEYELALLLPPSIEKFKRLFYSDKYVKLYGYSEQLEMPLVNKAALLITDHSDLQYRFAYMNKPVVYYYPHGLPIQQEYKDEGLAKSSFGELFFEHERLTEYLKANMAKGYEQPEKYSAMCEAFFAHHDTNNCKRIYKTILSTFFPD